VFDKESNLHFNHHRDYDPHVGRYVQSDPIGLAGGINTYGYVENVPTLFVDPAGLHKQDKWYGYDDREFQRWFHKCWKQPGDPPNADKQSIAEAYAEWVRRGKPTGGKCDGPNPPPAPAAPPSSGACGESCKQVWKTVRDAVSGALVLILVVVCTITS
jgi:RHS repeat-associated protein